MAPELVGLLSVGAIVALIYAGMTIAVALGVVSFAGVWILRGDAERALGLLGLSATEALASPIFAVVPLFVLMGMLVSAAGMGRDAFDVAQGAFGRVRGGLGLATVSANAVFAAITGISIASAAVFTRVAVPEMLRHGYAPRFAVGVVAGSSVLGMLIPPSLLLILYGIVAEQSIGDLFVAGLLPGLLLAALFCAQILLMARLAPRSVMAAARPRDRSGPRGVGGGTRGAVSPVPNGRAEAALAAANPSARSADLAPDAADPGDVSVRLAPDGSAVVAGAPGGGAARKLLPLLLLATLVLGGIYGGVFTPTEAGAVGAAGALAVALARRSLSRDGLWRVLEETGATTVSVAIVILAASLYATMLALSGLPYAAADWLSAQAIAPLAVIALYCLVVIALGCLLDSSSIILIAVPLMLPVLEPMGIDLIWFGVVTVVAVEIGLITPPFGLSIFVIKGALPPGTMSLEDIFRGALPFVGTMLVALALLVLFPSISLVLVR